jgi:hypothetical protein
MSIDDSAIDESIHPLTIVDRPQSPDRQSSIDDYQNPRNFHHTNPIVSQITTLAIDT